MVGVVAASGNKNQQVNTLDIGKNTSGGYENYYVNNLSTTQDIQVKYELISTSFSLPFSFVSKPVTFSAVGDIVTEIYSISPSAVSNDFHICGIDDSSSESAVVRITVVSASVDNLPTTTVFDVNFGSCLL